MRILLLTQVVPCPPDSGPKIKTHNLLRYLAERHEVHLVSFARGEAERTAAQSLKGLCASVTTVPLRRSRQLDGAALARSLVSGRPFLVERDDSTPLRRAIGELVGRIEFDAVHADQLTMGQFALDLPLRLRVLDAHNAVWMIVRRTAASQPPGPKRLLAELEWRKLRAYEGAVCRRFDALTVVSRDDLTALEAAAGERLNATIIPIAVDTQELAFQPRGPEARHLLSVATMFYPPNVDGIHWFATEAFPLVRRALPDRQLFIVGSRPPAKIRRLGSPERGIEVTGYVADLEPYLRRAGALVVPLRSASGMRVKILEAFARGLPVISTRLGFEGIEAQPGEHLLAADDPAGLAEAVRRVLSQPDQAARLARAGRALVEQRYDWRTALAAVERIYPTERPSAATLRQNAGPLVQAAAPTPGLR